MRKKQSASNVAVEEPKKPEITVQVKAVAEPQLFESFDWQNAPMGDTLGKLGDLKRFYDKTAAIVLSRQQSSPKIRKCWTMETHRHPEGAVLPRLTKQNCKRDIADGRELFRDDGAFEIIEGIRVLKPAVCCSVYCAQFYQSCKPMVALSRH